MRRTAVAVAVIASLGLLAAPGLFAGPDDDRPKSGDSTQGQHKTIQGVLAGVTAVGETIMNYQERRAITAEADYLTVVVTTSRGEKQAAQGNAGDQAGHPARQDRDVKPAANAGADGHRDQSPARAARVYLIQVTPRTQVCDRAGGGKQKCDLARLEIGDRVEVEFRPDEATGKAGQDTRHGRHRVRRGEAVSVSILHEPEGDEGRQE